LTTLPQRQKARVLNLAGVLPGVGGGRGGRGRSLNCTVMEPPALPVLAAQGLLSCWNTEIVLNNHTSSLKSHMAGMAIILVYLCRLGECNTGKNAPT